MVTTFWETGGVASLVLSSLWAAYVRFASLSSKLAPKADGQSRGQVPNSCAAFRLRQRAARGQRSTAPTGEWGDKENSRAMPGVSHLLVLTTGAAAGVATGGGRV